MRLTKADDDEMCSHTLLIHEDQLDGSKIRYIKNCPEGVFPNQC